MRAFAIPIGLAAALLLASCGANPRYETRRPDPTSALVVEPTLPGTRVMVDGTIRGEVGRKRLVIPVADGTREVRLLAPGGGERLVSAFIQNGSRRTIDPAKAFLEPQ